MNNSGSALEMGPLTPAPNGGGKPKIPAPVTPKGEKNKDGDELEVDQDERNAIGIAQILVKLSALDTKFDEIKVELREGLQSTEYKTEELRAQVGEITKRVDNNSEKIKDVNEVTEGLCTRTTVQGLRVSELERKIEQLERDKRKNIIILEGVLRRKTYRPHKLLKSYSRI